MPFPIPDNILNPDDPVKVDLTTAFPALLSNESLLVLVVLPFSDCHSPFLSLEYFTP